MGHAPLLMMMLRPLRLTKDIGRGQALSLQLMKFRRCATY